MLITNRTLIRLRHNPMGDAVTGVWRSAQRGVRDSGARLQLALGREPTLIGTPRLALEQWQYALRGVATPTQKPLLIAAIRNRRWVEWSIFSACYLLQMGYAPTILFSGNKIKELYGSGSNHFFAAARRLPCFTWIDLDPLMTVSGATPFDDFAHKAAHTLVAYDLKVEEYELEQAPGEYEHALPAAEALLRRYAVAADQVLRLYSDRRLICPSGLIGESLAIYEAARRLSHEAIYVEGWALRPGHNIWNLNRPALEYDVEGWLRSLGEWSDDVEQEARDYMAFREGHKVDRQGWLDNFHPVQRSSKNKPLPPTLEAFLQRRGPLALLGTNVVGDSSTLRRQTIFRSQQHWLEETIGYFKQHPEWSLIMRAHPDEMWVNARLRMGTFARQFAQGAPNIYIIGGDEDVNTYTLIEAIDLGLAWVSNVGLDMALRGKPVVMGAKPKYTGLGVVHEPATCEAYFQLVADLIEHPIGPDDNAIRRGKAYHHVVFKLLSLDADDRRYNAADYRLGDRYRREEQHKCYRILAGELENQGQPPVTDGNGSMSVA